MITRPVIYMTNLVYFAALLLVGLVWGNSTTGVESGFALAVQGGSVFMILLTLARMNADSGNHYARSKPSDVHELKGFGIGDYGYFSIACIVSLAMLGQHVATYLQSTGHVSLYANIFILAELALLWFNGSQIGDMVSGKIQRYVKATA